ncbi:calcium-binding protein [Polyangium jinanense]|uniref:Calcium-binding protein n=1 Tax=Polyangium jinanense TaxID=2829994 RepID=A0A9X4AT12_9BACT|nr:calcium-binding protein [Polyangium jinanense]MDC3981742.1 calcium-binding protein [Polyangium jinanense]
MAQLLRVARLMQILVPALALGATGCTAEVTSGDGEKNSGEGGGGGEGGDGEGGQGGECTTYGGDGCKPGEVASCNHPPDFVEIWGEMYMDCKEIADCTTAWEYMACATPLVLSFDQASVEYTIDATHTFDLQNRASHVTDWPTARTPWLALDRDGSGAIEDGSELFGSMSPLASGRTAPNGFVALREFDENHDGRIDALDPHFSRLLVWADRDADRRATPVELESVAAVEIESISLDYVSVPHCDARGNCEVERAPFVYRDAAGVRRTGTVIDVRLPPQR